MHRRRAGPDRVDGVDDRGQCLVIDRDPLGCVARLRLGRGDDDRHPFADIAHPVDRQWRPLGAEAFRAAHILGHHVGIERTEPVGRPILPRKDRNHPRRPLGGGLVDRADAGMRMRREQKHGIGLARQIDIRDIAAPPGQETRIFLARDGLPDAETHGPLRSGDAGRHDNKPGSAVAIGGCER
jgi:hypothetical protein